MQVFECQHSSARDPAGARDLDGAGEQPAEPGEVHVDRALEDVTALQRAKQLARRPGEAPATGGVARAKSEDPRHRSDRSPPLLSPPLPDALSPHIPTPGLPSAGLTDAVRGSIC